MHHLRQLIIAVSLTIVVHLGIAWLLFAAEPPEPKPVSQPILITLNVPGKPAPTPTTTATPQHPPPAAIPPQPVAALKAVEPPPERPVIKPRSKIKPKKIRQKPKKAKLKKIRQKPKKAKPSRYAKPSRIKPQTRHTRASRTTGKSSRVTRTASKADATSRYRTMQRNSGKSTKGKATGTNSRARPRADNPKPAYPAFARRLGHQGQVILRIVVQANGRVGNARIIRSSGSGVLDAAALKTIRRWRFHPARRAGQPVGATLKIPIIFRLDQRG